jgi:hypothetical protein
MPESFQTLPDNTRLVVFNTSAHPDISGNVSIQETLKADIPTYQITADAVVPASGKNLVSVFNNISGVRIRVQRIYAYARASGNNSMAIQVGYINSVPVSGTGTTASTFTGFAVDFPQNPAPPNNIIHMIGSTNPQPAAGIVLGGNRLSLSQPNVVDVFNANDFRNGSSLQLRGGQDGIVVKQIDGGALGTVTVHTVFTLD